MALHNFKTKIKLIRYFIKWDKNFFLFKGREETTKKAFNLLRPGGIQPYFKNDLFDCIHEVLI